MTYIIYIYIRIIVLVISIRHTHTHLQPDNVLWNQVQDNAECQFTVPNLKSVSHQPVFEVSAVDPHNFPGWEILQARWYWKQRVTVIKWQKVGANPTAKIDEGPATEMWTWAMQSCQPKSISKGLLPVAVLSHALAINDWCHFNNFHNMWTRQPMELCADLSWQEKACETCDLLFVMNRRPTKIQQLPIKPVELRAPTRSWHETRFGCAFCTVCRSILPGTSPAWGVKFGHWRNR